MPTALAWTVTGGSGLCSGARKWPGGAANLWCTPGVTGTRTRARTPSTSSSWWGTTWKRPCCTPRRGSRCSPRSCSTATRAWIARPGGTALHAPSGWARWNGPWPTGGWATCWRTRTWTPYDLSSRILDRTRRSHEQVPAAEELGGSRPRVRMQGDEGGVPGERAATGGGARGQGHRRLRVQLQAARYGLRVADGGRREEPDLLSFDLPRPSGHLHGLLSGRLAGDLPERGRPVFVPRGPLRPARRGQQPPVGLRDRRGRRRLRRRQVLRQDPEDALLSGEGAAAPLRRAPPPRGGDAHERERDASARDVGPPPRLRASLPRRGLPDTPARRGDSRTPRRADTSRRSSGQGRQELCLAAGQGRERG